MIYIYGSGCRHHIPVRDAKHHPHVAIVGISIGTGIATQVAAAYRPDRLVLVTPYDTMAHVGSDTFNGLPLGCVSCRSATWVSERAV